MKLAVDYPSIAYREGGDAVLRLASAIEAIGYDELAVFDHVVMGYETETRSAPMYPPQMPIIEAMMLMAYVAAATSTIQIGSEVLVLPQRQPTLVAKQVSTLDTLTGGRVRLGVGVGWQESEYEALEENFKNRGKRMDEAIELLRAYWGDERVEFAGEFYSADAIAMEPKPPQGRDLPIWVGGGSKAALRRVGRLGDGWMGDVTGGPERVARSIATIHEAATEAGRDPASIGLQAMLAPPPRSGGNKTFYADLDAVARRAVEVHGMGFEWMSINATAIFQAGARTVDAMTEQLGAIHDRLHAELD